MPFNKGLLSPELVFKLKTLTFSKEEGDILIWLQNITHRFRVFEKIVFVLFAFYSFISIVVFILASKIETLPKQSIVLLFLFYMVLGVFVYCVNVFGAGRTMNIYARLVSTVFDNILQSIYDTYTVSLAHIITKYPAPKVFSGRLSIGALAASNYQHSISQIVGVSLGFIFALVYGFVNGDSISLAISFFGFGTVVLFVLFMRLGRKYVKTEEKLSYFSDSIDQLYNDRKSLLFSNTDLIDKVEFEKKLLNSVNATTYINLTTYFVKFIVPIVLVFIPFLAGEVGSLFVFVTACLFITMKVFSQTTAASNYNSMAVAELKVKQLENLYQTINKVGAELTPQKYEAKKLEYEKSNITPSYKGYDGLEIRHLIFTVGRGEDERKIGLPELRMEKSKVHFLYGKSGTGKSIFGRILTLRYADYNADSLLLDGKDIRTFFSLQEGSLKLHFSSLRHITTSYRHAISIYISRKNSFEGIFEYAEALETTTDRVRKYFKRHCKYYGELDVSKFDILYAKKSLANLSDEDLLVISDTLRHSSWQEIQDDKILIVCMLLEYASLKYLKIFIPDATLYFMDAILSEPPISQGQRRRIILALDLLVKGGVFVADEPFANLDDKNSVNILNMLINYAKKNDAVVLVLDQKRRVSGKHFRSEKAGKVLILEDNTINISGNSKKLK